MTLWNEAPRSRAAEYNDYIKIDDYDECELFHPYYKEMHDRIIEEIKKEKPKFKLPCKILEVGPGTGLLTERYAGLNDITVDLVELDSKCCELLKELMKKFPNIKKIYNADFCKYEFKNHYDLILSSFSNHHVPHSKVSNFYDKIAKLLLAGGKFVFGEEYIPEYRTEDERIAALYQYHIHIIQRLWMGKEEGKIKEKNELIELEKASLRQGLKKEGEYKVSISQAKRDIEGAELKLRCEKIGPIDIPEEWGVYFCSASHVSS